MEEAPENGKELSHSAHGNGMNRGLCYLYSSPHIITAVKPRTMRWTVHATCMGDGKRPLGRPMSRWEFNIKMFLNKMGWEGTDCIHMVWDRGCCECGTESSGYIKCRAFLKKDS